MKIFRSTFCGALFALTLFGGSVDSLSAEDSAATSVWRPGADADKTPKPTLPDWATAAINETFARFEDWKGDDVVFVLPTITDVHSEWPPLDVPINWADSKTHVFILKATAAKFGADCVADLGDIGYDVGPGLKDENALKRSATNTLLYADSPVPVVFALGNHDHNRKGERFIDDREYGERFNGESKRRGLALQTGPDSDYGYVDFPEKKSRLFVMNTSDDKYEYGFSTEQLQFLADALASTPDGYAATVVGHMCIHFDIAHWTTHMNDKAIRGPIAMKIFADFVAGKDGSEDGVVWSFSKRGPGALSCVLAGDSHFDNFGRLDGVNYIVSQGFGYSAKETSAPGAVFRNFPRDASTLIDVVAVKPEKREGRVFRVGVGGADADRAFNF